MSAATPDPRGRADLPAAGTTWIKARSSLLWAAIVVFLLALPGAGFMIVFVVAGLLIWVPYAVFRMARRPDERAWRLARVGIWVLTVPLLYGIHHFRDQSARRNADQLVAAVEAFERAHGRYPASPEEIGLARQRVRDKLGAMGVYANFKGEPFLGYHTTFTPFGFCDYDFKQRAWRCRGG